MSAAIKHIVLIEDNDADAGIIEDALANWHMPCGVVRFRGGTEALAYLIDEAAVVPDVILLDLHMPRSNGFDVLQKIRDTPRLTDIPVGILSGSCAPNDRRRASHIGATCYVEKSSSYDEFLGGVRQAVEDMLHQREQRPEAIK